jgi:hypothetical protein
MSAYALPGFFPPVTRVITPSPSGIASSPAEVRAFSVAITPLEKKRSVTATRRQNDPLRENSNKMLEIAVKEAKLMLLD